jgi:MFS family permease
MGIVFAATGIGGFIFNPLTNLLILDYGWRMAYLVLGLVIAVLTVPVGMFVVRARPAEMGLRAYGEDELPAGGEGSMAVGLTAAQAMKTSAFWLLAVMILFIAIANMGVLHHIIPYLTDMGYSPTTAANLMSLHMAMLVLGKVVLGELADRIGLSRSLVACLVGLVISISILFGASVLWVAILFNVLFGLSISVRTILPPLMTSACLGPKHFGVIYGFLNIATTLGTAVGVPLSGVIYDTTRSYNYAFVLYMAIGVMAGILGLMALARKKV